MTNPASPEPTSQPPATPRGTGSADSFKAFFILWFGQVVSLTGTGLSRFGLGVWVFEVTGSITQYTLITFTGSLPGLLISPIAGALVDRWDRRTLLIVTDLIAGVAILAIAILHWRNGLELWHIFVYMAVTSLLDAFQIPAFLATSSLMVPKERLGKVAGMMQLAPALAGIAAPISAGFLMVTIGLSGVVLLDVLTFFVAVATLAKIRIPQPVRITSADEGTLREEILIGWRFLRERCALLSLLIFFALINFVFSVTMVLLTPMVLSFSSAAVLGMVSTVASVGLLAGGLMMSLYNGPRRRVYGVLAGGFCQGLAMIFVGLRPAPLLIAAGLFGITFSVAIVNSNSQAIWQSKVPQALQGRVFAVRRMIAQITQPMGQLIAGPLAERVFQPMLLPGGALFLTLGPSFGTGPGRGIGLMFVTFAFLPMLFAFGGCFFPRLRNLDSDLPDALPEEDPA
jgi:MFS family permease